MIEIVRIGDAVIAVQKRDDGECIDFISKPDDFEFDLDELEEKTQWLRDAKLDGVICAAIHDLGESGDTATFDQLAIYIGRFILNNYFSNCSDYCPSVRAFVDITEHF